MRGKQSSPSELTHTGMSNSCEKSWEESRKKKTWTEIV